MYVCVSGAHLGSSFVMCTHGGKNMGFDTGMTEFGSAGGDLTSLAS